MGSASLEVLITIQGMFPPNKNDDAEVKAETVPWPFGAPHST